MFMKLFKLYGKQPEDLYSEFDKELHFKPRINKADFFRLRGFPFGKLMLEPLSLYVKNRENEIEKARAFSYTQKALYYWWYLDAEVTNGGFVQFYYNGYGPYMPVIIKGLRHIGDNEMAALVEKADGIYQKKKKIVDKARKKDLFGSDLYDRLEELSPLDDEYYKINKLTMSKMRDYIVQHPEDFCVDEEGSEFDLKFSGECKTFYPDKTVKEIFYLENGGLDGVFKSYYENGKSKENIYFEKGEETGEKEEFYENGNKKYDVRKGQTSKQFVHTRYHENGHPQKLEHLSLNDDERIGEYKEWFPNGQLSKSGTYISKYERDGEWFEFYEDGSKKLEAEFKDKNFLIHNFWDKDGTQTLKDGSGLYINEYSYYQGGISRNESEYHNYKRHGKQVLYNDGVIDLYQEMENDKEHGYTRTYYKNGKLKSETLYENGKSVSSQDFPLFMNPRVETRIYSKVCTDCYKKDPELIQPDNEPELLNKAEQEAAVKADKSLIEPYGQERVVCYSYKVTTDKQGNVKDFRFLVADNFWIGEEVEKSIRKLKFEIAYRNDQPVDCIYIVQYKFQMVE